MTTTVTEILTTLQEVRSAAAAEKELARKAEIEKQVRLEADAIAGVETLVQEVLDAIKSNMTARKQSTSVSISERTFKLLLGFDRQFSVVLNTQHSESITNPFYELEKNLAAENISLKLRDQVGEGEYRGVYWYSIDASWKI